MLGEEDELFAQNDPPAPPPTPCLIQEVSSLPGEFGVEPLNLEGEDGRSKEYLVGEAGRSKEDFVGEDGVARLLKTPGIEVFVGELGGVSRGETGGMRFALIEGLAKGLFEARSPAVCASFGLLLKPLVPA